MGFVVQNSLHCLFTGFSSVSKISYHEYFGYQQHPKLWRTHLFINRTILLSKASSKGETNFIIFSQSFQGEGVELHGPVLFT